MIAGQGNIPNPLPISRRYNGDFQTDSSPGLSSSFIPPSRFPSDFFGINSLYSGGTAPDYTGFSFMLSHLSAV